MRPLWLLLIITASLAGCTGGDGSATAPSAPDDIGDASEEEPLPDLTDDEIALAERLVITEPVQLLDGPLQTFGTALASYGNGTRLAVAGVIDGDYHVRVSDDAGRTWNDAVQATDGAGATTHSAQAASIDFGGRDEIHLSWAGSDGINWAVSRDAGITWSDALQVDSDGSALDGFTDMAANEAGRIGIIWLRGQIEGGTGASDTVRGYYGAISEDGGQTWITELLPGANEPCDCCGAAVTMREDGTLFGLWRNIYNPGPEQARDYTLSTNTPGEGWSDPQRLEPSDWRYNGCPASASAISLAQDGTVTATWWTGAAAGPGYHLGQVAPGETEMRTVQALQYDAPASASSSATDGLGNAWALWADESTNPTTLRLAREERGVYTTLGTFEGDWPRMVGTPDGFVAVYMDDADSLQLIRGSLAQTQAVLTVDRISGVAPLTVDIDLKAAGDIAGTWILDDGQGGVENGTQLPVERSITYERPGTYMIRFSLDDGEQVHAATRAIKVVRQLSLPDPNVFRAGQPLVSCTGECVSASSPDQPVIDGFWVAIDEQYWGLGAAVKGDVSNVGGDGTGTVVFYDETLNELASGKATITPDGAAYAFAHGTFSIWGGSAVYEDMELVFTIPETA